MGKKREGSVAVDPIDVETVYVGSDFVGGPPGHWISWLRYDHEKKKVVAYVRGGRGDQFVLRAVAALHRQRNGKIG